jgi:dihydroxyacetone synthase
MQGKMTQDWTKLIPSKEEFPASPTASRKSAGLCCNPLASKLQSIMVGTADLTPSVNMAWKGKVDFQHVSPRLSPGIFTILLTKITLSSRSSRQLVV